MITIINYGVGNINAFVNIYHKLGIDVTVATTAKEVACASKLILPGVGHFDFAMDRFTKSGMREVATKQIKENGIPVIGICVGMQMLANSSTEGLLPGLGWIDAEVKKLDVEHLHHSTRLPHMGWNDIIAEKSNPLLYNLENEARFYFLHSYYFSCNNEADSIAMSEYGLQFTCAVSHANIFGVQFHPEKSHHFGIQLLKNFANL